MEVEWIARGDPEPSSEDAPESTHNREPAKPSSTVDEARVLSIPTGEGISEAVVMASAKPIVIILQEFPIVVTGHPGLPPP